MDQPSLSVITVASSVLEQLDLEVVLERVMVAARELTGARYAALGVLDGSRRQLDRFMTLGIDESTKRRIGALPTGRGVLGELIRSPEPLRIADVGRHPYSYGFPVGHPPMSSFLGVPIMVAGEPYGNLYLTEKQGAPEFSEDDERAAILLANFAGVAIGHAARFATSESQRVALERTVAALDATLQIAHALGGQTDLDAILELVAKRGRALVSARALVIELVHGDELELAAGAGEVPPELLRRRVPLANTVASAAIRARRTQRIADHLNRVRYEQHGLGNLGIRARDGLVVPLIFRDRAYGVIVAIDSLESDEFSPENESLLAAFAASAATAVATAQIAADEHRRERLAAAEAERSRWARELHDETLQALGNLRLMLAAARREGTADAMAGAIGRSLNQLELDIVTLRALITELRPAALDQLGLEPALMALIDRLRATGLEVDAHVDLAYDSGRCDTRLDPQLETGVYRIVQESLTNAVKHGDARRAVVEVIEEAGEVTVTVRDDGSGFDTTATTRGFGLVGIRERVELLSGLVEIDSKPGGGTKLTASLPVRVGGETRAELAESA